MRAKDYIPRNDRKFLEWLKNLYVYLMAHFSAWLIPSPQLTLEAPMTAFEAALTKLADPNYGKVDMER